MSSVPIMVSGVLWDHANKSGRAVTLMGEATIVGLGVGGGPVFPDQPPATQPPGTPTFPIWGPPGIDLPPKPGYPPVAGHPLPEPPPTEPPTGTPDDDGFIKTPPPGGGWAYHNEYQWLYSPGPGAAGPKKA
jgi:hypothetical protein